METTNNPPITDITRGIVNGAYDTDLDFIIQTATDRQTFMRRNTIDIGDHIKITGQIRPKYMIGATGTVEQINRTTATIRFDNTGTRYAGQAVRVPIGCIAPNA